MERSIGVLGLGLTGFGMGATWFWYGCYVFLVWVLRVFAFGATCFWYGGYVFWVWVLLVLVTGATPFGGGA